MPWEPISPELVLVDPELGARARAAHRPPAPPPRAPSPASSDAPPPAAPSHDRQYPFWARVTAALWLLVLGILIGGAAIPHAQDKPRVVPPNEDPAPICKPAKPAPAPPALSGPQP